jgi:cytochrome c-type biogenesis protein CcmH/NrfG
MKKETAILAIVIAFVVGLVVGVLSFSVYKAGRKPAMVPKPQVAPMPTPGPLPQEFASKIQTLKAIVKKDPKNLPAWVELGNLYYDTQQPKEGIEAYSNYLAVKPDNADVRTDMAILYRNIGEIDRALQEFKKAAEADLKHANSRYNIGIILLHDKGDIKGAIKAWEDYLKVDPNSERSNRIRVQMENLKKMAK